MSNGEIVLYATTFANIVCSQKASVCGKRLIIPQIQVLLQQIFFKMSFEKETFEFNHNE